MNSMTYKGYFAKINFDDRDNIFWGKVIGIKESIVKFHISTHGIWLLSGDKELFLGYDQFPWFKDVSISIYTLR
ncbi:MAG TPA: hypothetical protein VJ879_05535 [Desulfobacter sp.]|nr:hypothetical protein [Desulfobacter sp.]